MLYKDLSLEIRGKICRIFIGDWHGELAANIEKDRTLFLTDSRVYNCYREYLKDQKTIVVEPGERSKTPENLTRVYRQMLDHGADRSYWLIGFGGGVVTDLAGFAASTFMRGIRFGFVSTSLLGQVDAVIGGKNGINLDGFKNMIGTFNQPEFIVNDPAFFQTLPDTEFTHGLAEVIKQFLVADEEGLKWFDRVLPEIQNKNPDILKELIYRQNQIKCRIVAGDERENGLRKILNFGHTFGHALEKELCWSHGRAVAVGMVIALRLSCEEGLIDEIFRDFATGLIKRCGLPVTAGIRLDRLSDIIRRDKKKSGESIDFILLEGPGRGFIKRYDFVTLVQKIAGLEL
jgi:3-dehydroquinate synthase